MKLKNLMACLSASLLLAGSAYAQPENVVRMGVSSFAMSHFNLAYERVLGEKTSANLQLGYVYGFGGSLLNQVPDDITANVGIQPFKGFVMHTEFRFYSAKHGAPKGFYFAPYFRYSNQKANASYSYNVKDALGGNLPPDVQQFSVFSTDIRYNQVGLGIQLGTQFMIKDMVAIDWYWMGPRIFAQNTYTFTLNGDADPTRKSGLGMDDLASDVGLEEAFVDNVPVGGLVNYSQTASTDELEIQVKHPVFLFPWRFGISIGYAF